MKLHLDKDRFKEAILITAQEKGILPIYIEKDYWVTYVLWLIFTDAELSKYTIFKGGTALSKCYDLIERFSEDIDLTVLVEPTDNDNTLKKKIRTISKKVEVELKEMQVDGITHKRGNIRKTVHLYPIIEKANFGQVRDKVIVEASWLGNFEPFQSYQIGSFITEMLYQKELEEWLSCYNLERFSVNVLDIRRTFCEKIMSLVRFSFSSNSIEDLKMKIRHIYDIHKLLELAEIQDFLKSDEFEVMILKVGRDDVDSYKNDNSWLANHPKEAILFKKIEETWSSIRLNYLVDFKRLVYGDLPSESSILSSLLLIKERLNKVDWNLSK
ncbi:hypothetical protein AV926_15705 [Myroides marinus]|uniref:Nucleotidyl transferase AbiEii toxin, Type IV TA system n=1 Tax=Myroides marinus TaxID=703342 RepID=A0A163WNB3_9FLAO|nr:nucleotidyl transferase AbiEii/AbiGii toxin family protein [Myroides marinus]KZE76586.1 hypothetical protein AV926_15705 [Myroides marinus]